VAAILLRCAPVIFRPQVRLMVVVPLSAVPPHPTPLVQRTCEIVEHALGVGLPIALSIRHYSR
jgi:hypothetical protein